MKIIVLVILSLLVSCGPPIQYKDSILNYKGGVVVSKTYNLIVVFLEYECIIRKLIDMRLKLLGCVMGMNIE